MKSNNEKEIPKITSKNIALAAIGLLSILFALGALFGLFIVIGVLLENYILGGLITVSLIATIYFGIYKLNQ